MALGEFIPSGESARGMALMLSMALGNTERGVDELLWYTDVTLEGETGLGGDK